MKIIGHRGAAGLAPENTLASLQKALEYNVDMVEFDVRVTRDGIPILHHDARVTVGGTSLEIIKHTLAQLRELRADLATLAEALDVLGQTAAYVEIKPGEPIGPIVTPLKQHANKPIWLASKNWATLRALHHALPDLPIIVIEPWSGVRAGWRARRLGTRYVSMNQRWLWSGFIRSVRRGGHELYAYTLNDPAKAQRWVRHGLAGVVTDYPDRFTK